jgi:hypothetical protein
MPAPLESVLLTRGDYAVLRRIPAYWFDEAEAIELIGGAVDEPAGVVRRRVASLEMRGLIERRYSRTIAAPMEIRKIV